MGLPRTLAAYEDVKQALDAALTHGGIRRHCPDSPGHKPGSGAVAWRRRAHFFRTLLRSQQERLYAEVGMLPVTPYDALILRLKADHPGYVFIEFVVHTGQLETLTGHAITHSEEVREVREVRNDPLLDEAEAFARKLGL